MRSHPALQVADLYAWCVSNQDVDHGYDWKAKLLRMDRFDQLINSETIGETIGGSQAVWDSWKLPPRRINP